VANTHFGHRCGTATGHIRQRPLADRLFRIRTPEAVAARIGPYTVVNPNVAADDDLVGDAADAGTLIRHYLRAPRLGPVRLSEARLGYRHVLRVDPATGIGVAVLTNVGNAYDVKALIDAVMDAFTGRFQRP
jgi:hypothetical protein